MKEFVKTVKQPYQSLKESIAKILPVIKRTAEKIKNKILSLKKNLVFVGKFFNQRNLKYVIN